VKGNEVSECCGTCRGGEGGETLRWDLQGRRGWGNLKVGPAGEERVGKP